MRCTTQHGILAFSLKGTSVISASAKGAEQDLHPHDVPGRLRSLDEVGLPSLCFGAGCDSSKGRMRTNLVGYGVDYASQYFT